jgi:hypothetical protein
MLDLLRQLAYRENYVGDIVLFEIVNEVFEERAIRHRDHDLWGVARKGPQSSRFPTGQNNSLHPGQVYPAASMYVKLSTRLMVFLQIASPPELFINDNYHFELFVPLFKCSHLPKSRHARRFQVSHEGYSQVKRGDSNRYHPNHTGNNDISSPSARASYLLIFYLQLQWDGQLPSAS